MLVKSYEDQVVHKLEAQCGTTGLPMHTPPCSPACTRCAAGLADHIMQVVSIYLVSLTTFFIFLW